MQRHQRRWPWSARPLDVLARAAARARRAGRGRGRARRAAGPRRPGAAPRGTSGRAGRRSRPCRGAAISGGRSAANACLSAVLPAASSGGSARPSSTTRWSRNGERSSSETAIEAMSAFGSRSPGRYDSMSTRRRSSAAAGASPSRARAPRPSRAAGAARAGRPRPAARSARPARLRRRRRGSARARKSVERGSRRAPGERGERDARRAARRHAAGERVRAVALVAAEDLVAAVADERDLDVPARRLADEQRRQRGLVAERLVEGAREPLESPAPGRSRAPRARVPYRSATARA